MRAVPADWDAANKSRIKRPRYIMRLSFSDTDQYYFTSHADCPLPAGALSYPSTISNRPRGISQKLYKSEGRSDVGKLVVSLIDRNGAISDLIQQKRASGIGMNGRKVEMLIGFADQPFDSYVVVATQIIRRTQLKGGRYTITCNDIQRALKKEIFTAAETVLTQTLEEGDTTIYVGDTSGFQLVAHGSSYSDAPDQTVGYVRIEDEIIRYTGTTANTLTGITRGVLNTAPARHVVDASGNTSPPPVTEYIYLEMPAVKLALALMTGDLYGQSGARLPDGWHLGIDPVYVRESDYTAIGADWWDPANDQAGVIVRFEGLKKQDGKSFIGQQLMLLLGAFQPVYSDGTLGLKRATRTLSSAAHLGVIGVSDLAQSLAEITIDDALDEVVNIVTINWNYDPVLDRTTRTTVLVDDANGAAHGYGEQKDLTFLGLHGSRHSMEVLQARFDAIHDAFSAPPKRLRLTLKHRWNTLEVGDVVRVQLPLRDNAEAGDLDRAFEVQSVQVDWYSGNVVVDLFGSTGTPGRSALSVSTVLPDNVYTSQGVELSSALPAGAVEIIGGVAHLTTTNMPTGGYELAGGADIAGSGSVYHYAGDLTIDSGVTLNITGNVMLWVMGHFAVDGKINGRGRGLQADTGPGYLGSTESMGAIDLNPRRVLDWVYYDQEDDYPGTHYDGAVAAVPVTDIVWDGQSLLTYTGDRRGTSGAVGRTHAGYTNSPPTREYTPGGAGGNGGAALGIVCRGMNFGVSGVIDLSGTDGQPGQPGYYSKNYTSGSGSGGYAGALIIHIDGTAGNFPVVTQQNFIADIGVTPLVGYAPDHGSPYWPRRSQYSGLYNTPSSAWDSAYVVNYVTDASTRKEDPSVTIVQPPTALSLASGDAYVRVGADGSRTARINVSFTASVNEYLSGHEIQYKRSADPDSAYESVSGILPVGVTVATFSPPEDGVEYTVRVRARNRFGYVSDWMSGTVVADGKSTPPAAPSGLVGTGVPNGIQWAWNNSADNDIRYTEIHIATTNNRAQASLQGRISAENWLQDGLTPGVTQYCWIRHVDTSGNAGAWYPSSATAGIAASAGAQDYGSIANTPTQLADINAVESATLNKAGDEPNQFASMYALSAKVAHVSGSATYICYEDGTDIYVNRKLVVDNGAKWTAGQLDGLAQGDVITSNKPIGVRLPGWGILGSVATAGQLFWFRTMRASPHTVYVWAPYGNALLKWTKDTTDFSTPNEQLCQSGQITTFQISDDNAGHSYWFRSDVPVVMLKRGTGQDNVTLLPASREVLLQNAGSTQVQETIGSNPISFSNGYLSCDSPAQRIAIGDGAGGDAEVGVPWIMCGDSYVIDHAITGYTIVAIEPCTVRVYYSGGTLYKEHDLTAASRSNPLQIVEADQTGSGATIGAGPWVFVSDSAPFYVRTNDLFAREYPILGYRTSLRQVQQDATKAEVVNYADGTPVEALQPEEAGANNTANNTAGRGVNVANVRYSSFESNDSPPVAVVRGTVGIDNTRGYFGSSSLRISATGNDCYAWMGINNSDFNIKLEPNRKWIVSLRVSASVASAAGQIYLRVEDGSIFGANFTTSATVEEWSLASAVLDLTANSSTLGVLRIDNDAGAGVDMWVDGIMIEAQVGNQTTPSEYALPGTSVEGYSWGADVTQAALEALMQLTSGGLQLTGGDAKIMLGLATALMTGAGVYMADNNGVPVFRVGDPAAGKYLQYDTNGDVVVGPETTLIGVDAFGNGNDQLYVHIPFHAESTLFSVTNGANSAVTTPSGAIKLFLDNSSNPDSSLGYATANYRLRSEYFFKQPLFDSPIKWRVIFIPTKPINTNNPGDSFIEVAFGRRDIGWEAASATIGFRFYTDSSLNRLDHYIFSRYGSSETEVLVETGVAYNSLTGINLYIEYDPATGAEFFIDGVSVGIITTNIPPSNAYVGSVLRVWMYAQTTNTGYTDVEFGEFTFLKEP